MAKTLELLADDSLDHRPDALTHPSSVVFNAGRPTA